MSLAEVMLECQTIVEPLAQKRGISMTFPQFETPVYQGDRTRVKQVFINLLSNAIKYNKAGGTVIVNCSRAPIAFASASRTPARDCLLKSWRSFSSLQSSRSRGGGKEARHRPCRQQAAGELMQGASASKARSGGKRFLVRLISAVAPQLAAESGEAEPSLRRNCRLACRGAPCSMSRTTRRT